MYFGVYLVLWTVAVSAALTNATGLGIANLTGGAISQPWGAVLHSLFGFAFVLLGGYAGFEKLMKALVGVMGFSILVCAVLTFQHPGATLRGTVGADDPAGERHVRAVDHRRHRRIDHDAVLQLLDARGDRSAARGYLGYVRGDIAIAYLFTALFGISIMLIANQAFFVPGVKITDAQAVPKMAEMLGAHPRPVRRVCVLDRVLGGGVCVAAGRLAERAVSLRRLLQHPQEAIRSTSRQRGHRR